MSCPQTHTHILRAISEREVVKYSLGYQHSLQVLTVREQLECGCAQCWTSDKAASFIRLKNFYYWIRFIGFLDKHPCPFRTFLRPLAFVYFFIQPPS